MALLKGIVGACMIATSVFNPAYAQDGGVITPAKKHYWLDASFTGKAGGGIGLGLHLNIHTDKHNWVLGYDNLDQDILFSGHEDRATGDSINGDIKTYSVSKLWHWPYRLGHTSVSVGGSLLKGYWGVNCGERSQLFFGTSQECDRKQFTTLGIPIRATASFGRYVGIGYVVEININTKEPYALAGIIIPIGGFAR